MLLEALRRRGAESFMVGCARKTVTRSGREVPAAEPAAHPPHRGRGEWGDRAAAVARGPPRRRGDHHERRGENRPNLAL